MKNRTLVFTSISPTEPHKKQNLITQINENKQLKNINQTFSSSSHTEKKSPLPFASLDPLKMFPKDSSLLRKTSPISCLPASPKYSEKKMELLETQSKLNDLASHLESHEEKSILKCQTPIKEIPLISPPLSIHPTNEELRRRLKKQQSDSYSSAVSPREKRMLARLSFLDSNRSEAGNFAVWMDSANAPPWLLEYEDNSFLSADKTAKTNSHTDEINF
eukprot:GDKJ01009602.1.p1 GENE.GDKJ01009602.1~~GDKJ01009602.1.p1  ORF type:complete len:229 (-),score=32.20 GDKJ01009602.1:62-718(-)